MVVPSSIPTSARIILTGARGRLASCLDGPLQLAGHEVVRFSRRGGEGYHALETLVDSDDLINADALLHLAWSTLPATSERDIGREWKNDLPLLIQLLRRIVDSPARDRLNFIFFSSGGSVYGENHGHPAQENDRAHPIGWYAQAKVAAEEIIRIFGERHGLRYTILRISNPYGFRVPRERVQGIIPRIFECAWTGQTLSLWGDGAAKKDFIHYSDFTRALQQVVERQLTGIYNLGTGISTAISEVIQKVEDITRNPVHVTNAPSLPWDVQVSHLDIAKFCAATGWRPTISLDEGLRLTAKELRP
jgi:UDP-glucose 4-epimerase